MNKWSVALNLSTLLRTGYFAFAMTILSSPAQTQEALVDCPSPVPMSFFGEATLGRVIRCIPKEVVNRRDTSGNTPLHIAAMANADPRFVRYLIRRGADMDLRNLNLRTPLHEAAQHSTSGDVVSAMILYGANVDARVKPERDRLFQRYGDTALHLAAGRDGGANVIAALLVGGADANAVGNDRGRTPLHIAAQAGEADISALLGFADADASKEDDLGNTPFHLAASNGTSIFLLQVLAAAGGSVDQGDDNDVTPLMLAAAHNTHPEILEFMFQLSEEPCAADGKGRTALSNAKQNSKLFQSDAYWKLHQRCTAGD